ncbi:nucleolar complex protein 3 homolog [Oppia nitens]|uniref:nucleolar complex protein 3 homolog n=1 Tax=Oppia nitens TaxID=1686743 RepID=UPI0023D9EF92|nr:nucleolar complex protein 3 homolog [Oppia nitens]
MCFQVLGHPMDNNNNNGDHNIIDDEVADDDDNSGGGGGNDDQSMTTGGSGGGRPKSLVQLYAQRTDALAIIKTRIANHSVAVITHPEINMNRLRDLLAMFDIRSDDKQYGLVFFSVQKLVALAAAEVFKDILPNYRVKEKINEEEDEKNARRKNFQLKKETKRLREYEKTLIQLYRLFLNRLNRMVDAVRYRPKKSQKKNVAQKSDFYDQMGVSDRAKQRLAIIGVKCLSQLVLTHPHFNFRQQIVETLVQLMANTRVAELADISCQTVERIYRSDKLGEISAEAVKETAKLVKQRNYRLPARVLRTLLALRIKEVNGTEEKKKDMKELRNRLDLMSRKERKRNKRMQKMDNQLLETEAQESHQRRLAFHTEILNQIFVTYFRILKHQSEINYGSGGGGGGGNHTDDIKSFNVLLTPVLEGLSKFAHLINYEFFDDLIGHMYRLIHDKCLDSRQTFHCLQTVFTILSGEGQALNIDFHRFYAELYGKLMAIDCTTDTDDVRVLLSCLHSMIIKRKKQMTQNRVLAFTKRLATISLNSGYETTVSLLAVVRQIMQNHKYSDILLDSEDTVGSGLYQPDVDDPEHCNANSTQLWELTALTKHYEPLVRQYSRHIINGSSGNEVSFNVLKRFPSELLDEFTDSIGGSDYNWFVQQTNQPVRKKLKFNFSLINSDDSLTTKCLNYLQNI